MLPTLLQQWTTVSAASTLTTFTQSAEDWLDVSGSTDAAFWIDVSQISGSSGAVVQLVLQGSPTRDGAYFNPVTAPVTLVAGATPTVVKTVRSVSALPLSRFLRWQLQSSNNTATWGATFRIRAALSKQSFFVPTQLPGCVLWLRGDLGITLVNTVLVSAWADQSGQGNNATQVSPNQPTYVVSDANFGGVSDVQFVQGPGPPQSQTFLYTAGGCPGGAATHTLFAVGQWTNLNGNYQGAVGYGGSGTGNLGSSTVGTTNGNSWWFGGSNEGGPFYGTADGHTHVLSKTFDGSNVIGYLDGIDVASGSVSSPSMGTTICVGAYAGTAGQPSQISLAESIIYNRVLSAADIVRVHRYLGGRYGVSVP